MVNNNEPFEIDHNTRDFLEWLIKYETYNLKYNVSDSRIIDKIMEKMEEVVLKNDN